MSGPMPLFLGSVGGQQPSESNTDVVPAGTAQTERVPVGYGRPPKHSQFKPGVLTGRGGDVLIIDDPIKPLDAQSDTRRARANEWFDGTLYSRLNSKVSGAIIVIMQRLHEDDLPGHLLHQSGWELLNLPAIAERDKTFVMDSLFGPKTVIRKTGEALHAAREDLATLERIRSTIGTYNFTAQYQQTPTPTGGGYVRLEWFRTYTYDQEPQNFDQIIQSWDTANKATELSDYSVCTTWGMKQSHFYLLNVYRKKVNFPDLKRAVIEQNTLFRPTAILIEDKASGTQLIQQLIQAGLSHITGIKPEDGKVMRLHGQTAKSKMALSTCQPMHPGLQTIYMR